MSERRNWKRKKHGLTANPARVAYRRGLWLRFQRLEPRYLLAGTLEGTVFQDLPGGKDGIWETGETGVEGRPVYLDLNANGKRDDGEPFDVTDGAGRYKLVTSVAPFSVQVDSAETWELTHPRKGPHQITSDTTNQHDLATSTRNAATIAWAADNKVIRSRGAILESFGPEPRGKLALSPRGAMTYPTLEGILFADLVGASKEYKLDGVHFIDAAPQTNGEHIVVRGWDKTAEQYDLYLIDTSDDSIRKLVGTTNGHDPRLVIETLVYVRGDTGERDVFLYDLTDHTQIRIDLGTTTNYSATIDAEGNAAFIGDDEIYVRPAGNSTKKLPVAGASKVTDLILHDGRLIAVAWFDNQSEIVESIDLDEVQRLTDNTVIDDQPAMLADLNVWRQWDAADDDFDIRIRDASGTSTLSDDGHDQTPRLAPGMAAYLKRDTATGGADWEVVAHFLQDGHHGTVADGEVVSNLNFGLRLVNVGPTVEMSDTKARWIEDAGAIPVDASVKLQDPDSETLTKATYTIVVGCREEDLLEFPPRDGFKAEKSTCRLTITADKSVAEWEAALRTVVYDNAKTPPATGLRQVHLEVSDGLETGSDARGLFVLANQDTFHFHAEVVDDTGGAISRLEVGEFGTLRVLVEAPLTSDGPFAAYRDYTFEKDLVEPTSLEHGNFFPHARAGDFTSTPGTLDEVGATAAANPALGPGKHVLAELRFTAKAAGDVTFQPDPADVVPAHLTLAFGRDDPIPEDRIVSPAVSIEVVTPATTWTNPRNRRDVNDDGLISPLDVLVILNELNDPVYVDGKLPDTPTPPPYFDVTGDWYVAPIDGLWIINFLNGEGEGEAPASEILVLPLSIAEPVDDFEPERVERGAAWFDAEADWLDDIALAVGEATTGTPPHDRALQTLSTQHFDLLHDHDSEDWDWEDLLSTYHESKGE